MARIPAKVKRQREDEAWELYIVQGKTQGEIARIMGLSPTTIYRTLKAAANRLSDNPNRANWLAERILFIRLAHTARLEQIAAEARAAWVRSMEASTRLVRRMDVREADLQEGVPQDTPIHAESTVEMQCGDLTYLRLEMDALNQIREIWGVDAPDKILVGVREERSRAAPALEPEQAFNKLARIAGRLGSGRPGPSDSIWEAEYTILSDEPVDAKSN